MASAMRAARAQLETATHNLANVSSDGFRRATSQVRLTAGGLVTSRTQSFEQGAIRHTGAIDAQTTVRSDGEVRSGGRSINWLPLPAGTRLQSGALETSNVNAIGETLGILTAQRAFETAQKVLVAIDDTRQKAVNDVVRLK